jgi:hypothetical protein
MMNKKVTLLLTAAALYCLPSFSQVSSNSSDVTIDSLEGFQLDVALQQSGEAHEAAEAENQIRLAKRDYIDKKFHLGRYAPGYGPTIPNAFPPFTPQAACSNVDFETGDFSNWIGTIGDNTAGNTSPLQNVTNGFFTVGPNAALGNANARHTLITSAYGNDYYGGFPGVPPGAGNYTVRMGGTTPNTQGETMEQTFIVSPTSTSFAYRYAVVLNDPPGTVSHPISNKPYFRIDVLDGFGQPISSCTQYFVISDPNVSGFFQSPHNDPNATNDPVFYKPWTTVNFDLSGYVSQNITVRFTVAGCTQSGHFGYCYFDCACSALAATANFCPGNTSVYLTAPDGYAAYQWLDTAHVAIPGATNDTLIVNNPVLGDTFYVYLTSSADTSCHNTLPVVLEYTHILPNATSTNPTCWHYNDGTATATGTIGFPPYTYTWLTSPNQTSQTITGLAPGNYVVHMNDSLGCESYDTVTVAETPRLDTSQSFTNYCQGNPNLILSVPGGYANYVWVDNIGDTLSNNSNSIVINNPTVGTNYYVVLIPPPGCPVYDSISIPPLVFTTIYPNPTSTSPACFGYNNGVLTANGSNGISPYSYSWNTSPVQNTQTATNISAGTYIVHITDSLGCTNSDTIVVNQPAQLDTALFSYRYCPSNPNVILYAPSGYAGYVWTDPSGNPIPNGTLPYSAVVVNPVVGSVYYCVLTPPPGCPVIDSIVIPVMNFITVNPNATSTNAGCWGYSDGTVSSNPTLGIIPYSYSWNTNPSQNTPSISNLPIGTYIVHVSDSMGCTGVDTVVVSQPARLDTSLFTYQYCIGDPNMNIYAPPGFTFYTWIGPNHDTIAVNSSLDMLTLTNPQMGQLYSCILYSPPACPIYDSVILGYSPPAFYFQPDSTVNVFTPNGDLKNDIFYPYFDYSVSSQSAVAGQPAYDFFQLHIKYFEIWIYDRWGNQVFYSNDYKFGWDGTVDKGKACTEGVYYWVSKMTSNCSYDASTPIVSKGFVHLMR